MGSLKRLQRGAMFSILLLQCLIGDATTPCLCMQDIDTLTCLSAA